MIGLIEIGQDAAIAPRDAGIFSLNHVTRLEWLLVVHELEALARHFGNLYGIGNQSVENARATFSRFIKQNGVTNVPGRQRLAKDFALFELEDQLDAADKRMLEGRHLLGAERNLGLQQEGIFMVFDHRHDALLLGLGGITHAIVIVAVFWILEPTP